MAKQKTLLAKISVVARDGKVQLSRSVENQTQIDRTIEVAQKIKDVKNKRPW